MQDACEDRNVTIVFASHDRRKIDDWADKCLFIENGEIVFEGSPAELKEFGLTDEVLGPSTFF